MEQVLMELFEAIALRHSYRGAFTPQSVPRSDLQKIVQAGIQAPSAKNEQVASFIIVDDPALLRSIADIVTRPSCNTARAMILCVVDPRPVFHEFSLAEADCAASVENMLLAITALGYATVWIDGALRLENRAERIGGLFNLPPDRKVAVLLPLGVPVEHVAQREKLPFDRRAWFNVYGD
jgi:nitroreductase